MIEVDKRGAGDLNPGNTTASLDAEKLDIEKSDSKETFTVTNADTFMIHATIELHINIWKEACLIEPRLIDIFPGYCDDDGADYGEEQEYLETVFSLRKPVQIQDLGALHTAAGQSIPSVLHTSRESRRAALEVYSLASGRTIQMTTESGSTLSLTHAPKFTSIGIATSPVL
ncbi:uncharacterized protein PAC_16147 [Phialocephala subalpina]|uniref:2EXR domain-containing protein n=1 Tax=Phialocephala subalpina TaxID=576137 RepID=A0A1L7XMT6_9HELO|nr:uncharacterized protein PAC_16147 [Phialocephala subalpina]